MRAILIDPFTQNITDIELTALKEVAQEIGCMFVLTKDFGKNVIVYVDPDLQGFYKTNQPECLPQHGFFAYEDKVIAGRAVIIGGIGTNDVVPCTVSVDEVRANVIWTTPIVDEGSLFFPLTVTEGASGTISDRGEV
ncbi:MAG: hypothetical protein FD176_1155 [Rhodospirillaceae bacterium]|nr:MAG: hypothetical protein FD176_1155 [Rhodospirillaceae bacterium]TNC97254.1 MAG: hypothetical protein FD119_1346 [Stygiobacter sp.]